MKLNSLKNFVAFWDRTAARSTLTLSRCLKDGKCLFVVIDMISDDNPIVRHTAAEWLSSTKRALDCLLDPLLAILLHKYTIRVTKDKVDFYAQEYDVRRTFEAIRKFKMIYETEDILKKIMDEELLSPYAQQLIEPHHIDLGTYLEVTLNVIVLFLNTDSEKQRKENRLIQSAACEFLLDFVKELPCPLAFKVLEGCVKYLYKGYIENNGVTQTLAINTIRNILFYCELEKNPIGCVEIFSSQGFCDSLLQGIETNDSFLRSTWVKFITDLLPFLIYFLEHPRLTHYIGSLTRSYVQIISATHDANVMQGLKALIHVPLGIEICSKKQVITFVDHPNVKSMLLNELDDIFSLCINLFKAFDPSVRRDASTLEFDIIDELTYLLAPIANHFTHHFIGVVIEIWSSLCFGYNDKNETMDVIIKILPHMNLEPLKLIQGLIEHLSGVIRTPENKKELCIGHLLNTILVSPLRSPLEKSTKTLWTIIIKGLRLLLESIIEETLGITIEILYTLSSDTFAYNSLTDKKLKREVQELIEASVEKLLSNSLRIDRIAYKFPYSINSNLDSSPKVFEILLHTFREKGLDVLYFYIPTKEVNSLITNIANSMMSAIVKSNPCASVASELILKLLFIPELKLLGTLKKESLEFICSPNFLTTCSRFPEMLETWLKIIQTFSSSYPDSSKFLKEILDKHETGLFSSSSYAAQQFKHSIITLSLLLLSESGNEYINSLDLFTDKLKNSLKSPDTFPFFCIFLSVLLIKTPKQTATALWQLVWPDLSVLLISNLSAKNNLKNALYGLKVIDLAVAVNFEDIYSVLWIYFFDIPEIQLFEGRNGLYLPLIAKEFLCGFSACPVKLKRTQTEMLKKVTKRPLLLGQGTQPDEDLDRHAKTLIQFCMYYNSTMCTTDYNSIEKALQIELIALNEQLYA